jgi:hypothetical protein
MHDATTTTLASANVKIKKSTLTKKGKKEKWDEGCDQGYAEAM